MRIFSLDIAYLVGVKEQHFDSSFEVKDVAGYTTPYRTDDDIACFCEFNEQARGVSYLNLKVPSEYVLSQIANKVGQQLLAHSAREESLRVGLVGIQDVGKTTVAKSLFGSNMRLFQSLSNRIATKEKSPRRIIEGYGRDFGRCVFVDACESMPEYAKGVSQGGGYAEYYRAFKEIDAMYDNDILVMEHPHIADGEVDPVELDRGRDKLGFDLIMFLYQLKGSEERHLTLVVPQGGRLNGKLQKLSQHMRTQHASLVRTGSKLEL